MAKDCCNLVEVLPQEILQNQPESQARVSNISRLLPLLLILCYQQIFLELSRVRPDPSKLNLSALLEWAIFTDQCRN